LDENFYFIHLVAALSVAPVAAPSSAKITVLVLYMVSKTVTSNTF
jgi:hypothetical protein